MKDCPLFVGVLACALALVPYATAVISAGSVTLKPSGVLSMIVEWEDKPKNGTKYDIYLITTLYSTGSTYLHRLNNLEFATEKMSYNIPSGRRTEFVSGNSPTTSWNPTFPGFAPDNQYRAYIRYVNAAGVQLNSAVQSTEMSTFSAAMVQATPPLNLRTCAPADRTDPCNLFVPVAYSARIMWDRPTKAGYNLWYPTPSYDIDYYVVELSADQNFLVLADKVTCPTGLVTTRCGFNRRVVLFSNLTAASTYYYRVRAGTVIGDGQNSSTGVIRLCDAESNPNAAIDASCFLNYSTGCSAGYDYASGCSACAGGKYSRIADETCKDCEFGFYSNAAAAKCIPCPAGTYNQESSTATVCTNCLLGTYSTTVGSTSRHLCNGCDPGKFSDVTPTSTCKWCEPGTFQRYSASTTCLPSDPCQAGMYQGTTGATVAASCVACPMGKYSSAAALTCTDCPEGKYGGAVGATAETQCTVCVSNTTSPAGSTSSDACVCVVGFGINV